MRCAIQRRVDNELSNMILSGSPNPGERVIDADEEARKLTFEVKEGAADPVAGAAE